MGSERISEVDVRGDCNRCHVYKQGVKLYLLETNRSFAWSEINETQLPSVSNYLVCMQCLTEEEIAKLLLPIAMFVIQTLYLNHTPSEGLKAACHVMAMMLFAVGPEVSPAQMRARALKALG